MPRPIANSGEIVKIESLDAGAGERQTEVLVKTADVRLVHLSVPAGENIPTHQPQGPVIIHCLQGRVSVDAREQTFALQAGELLYLVLDEPFSIAGIEDSLLLATFFSPQEGTDADLIGR